VQLADFMAERPEPTDSAWAELREAQTMTQDRLPNTGQAVIIDIGEANDIHPRNKLEVAKRLARWALARDYGQKIAHQSPRYESHEVKGDTVIIKFKEVGGGLRANDVSELKGFAIAGPDRRWTWAEAKIVAPDQVAVRSYAVPNPTAVRYAWADNPVCNLYNTTGLPVTPFRTDDWPGVTIDARCYVLSGAYEQAEFRATISCCNRLCLFSPCGLHAVELRFASVSLHALGLFIALHKCPIRRNDVIDHHLREIHCVWSIPCAHQFG
jgi:hypothetical protein